MTGDITSPCSVMTGYWYMTLWLGTSPVPAQLWQVTGTDLQPCVNSVHWMRSLIFKWTNNIFNYAYSQYLEIQYIRISPMWFILIPPAMWFIIISPPMWFILSSPSAVIYSHFIFQCDLFSFHLPMWFILISPPMWFILISPPMWFILISPSNVIYSHFPSDVIYSHFTFQCDLFSFHLRCDWTCHDDPCLPPALPCMYCLPISWRPARKILRGKIGLTPEKLRIMLRCANLM